MSEHAPLARTERSGEIAKQRSSTDSGRRPISRVIRAARSRVARASPGADGSDLLHKDAIVESTPGPRFQAKLRVGATNDPAEREADRIGALFASRRASTRVNPQVRPSSERVGSGGPGAPALESGLGRIGASGRPLDRPIRRELEQFFGRDLGGVRVHRSSAAESLSRSVDAAAFTSGRDIVFGRGTYRTRIASADHLLAHEVTHVIQQGGSRIARVTTVQRAPALKQGSTTEYVDAAIPGATLRATGAATSAGANDYEIVETGEVFTYNSVTGKYSVGSAEVNPASLIPPARMAASPSTPSVVASAAVTSNADPLRTEYDRVVTSSKGKMTLSFEDWKAARAAKLSAKSAKDITKPVDITNDEQLKSLWGPAARFEKWACARAIIDLFTTAGYKVGAAAESSGEKSSAPDKPVLFAIEDHPMIALFEIHPGAGSHGAAYIRISTHKGMIKVWNTGLGVAYIPLGEKGVKFVDVRIPAT